MPSDRDITKSFQPTGLISSRRMREQQEWQAQERALEQARAEAEFEAEQARERAQRDAELQERREQDRLKRRNAPLRNYLKT